MAELHYTPGRPGVVADLDRLVASRMLIQANSGGGKSRAIRQLLEETHGRVQHLVIDPEGEFASLRERFDYVLVAKTGGDVACVPKHAAVLCRRLLELGASAVLDLYDLSLHERREFVKVFLTALMHLPRELWRPVLVVIDEAHVFVPERGSGESQSTDAVITLCTQGRKRGFAAVLATQRISKLHKDAAAELLNKMVGRTGLDIDMKRAGEELGFDKEQRGALKLLAPGEFYVYGPALGATVMRVSTGAVLTRHPEAGGLATAPPAPKKVQAMLAQLADLPKEAEAEAQSLADLRKENAQLKADARRAAAAKPAASAAADPAQIRTAVERAVVEERKQFAGVVDRLQRGLGSLASQLGTAKVGLESVLGGLPDFKSAKAMPAAPLVPIARAATNGPPVVRAAAPAIAPMTEGLTNPEQRILDAAAWLDALGITEPTQVAVAYLANYTAGAGAFNNVRAQLKAKGLIVYLGERLALTDAGRSAANTPDRTPTNEELHARVMEKLDGPGRRVLACLIERHPDELTKADVAAASGYTAGAGAFNNTCGRLRSLGLVTYPQGGTIRAADLLFPEGR